jgi:glucokinase
MSRYTVGIDLGGTKIYSILLDENQEIISRMKAKTPRNPDFETVSAKLQEVASQAVENGGASWDEVEGIGIAVPSPVDQATGRIIHAPNLGWRDLPARTLLEERFQRRVALDNDVNCGLFAEAEVGSAQGADTVVGFFIGTGAGGGVTINGRLQTGTKGIGGELGHMIIKHGGRKCGCGHRGCLEAYCSKTAFGRRFEKLIVERGRPSMLTDLMGGKNFKMLKSSVLAKAYRNQDSVVCEVLDEGAYMLGLATANLTAILGPDCFVYGGGVMEALGEELLPGIRAGIRENLFGLEESDLRLELSSLADDAVALGAALLIPASLGD